MVVVMDGQAQLLYAQRNSMCLNSLYSMHDCMDTFELDAIRTV